MKRAEIRREKRAEQKKTKTMIMTPEELERYKNQAYEIAKGEFLKELKRLDEDYKVKFAEYFEKVATEEREKYIQKHAELSEEIFKMMLVIPSNVLIGLYWPKTAHRKMPGFLDDCLRLYNSWVAGSISMTEMQELTEKYGKIQLVGIDTATGKALEERRIRGID